MGRLRLGYWNDLGSDGRDVLPGVGSSCEEHGCAVQSVVPGFFG